MLFFFFFFMISLSFHKEKSMEELEQAKTTIATLVSTFTKTIVPAVIQHGRIWCRNYHQMTSTMNQVCKFYTCIIVIK